MPFPSYNFIDERISYLSFSSIQTKVKSIVLQRENIRLANCTYCEKGTFSVEFDEHVTFRYPDFSKLPRSETTFEEKIRWRFAVRGNNRMIVF